LNISLKDVTERLVTETWQNLIVKGCKLKTASGQSLTVLYPGKTSDAPGSDFQDAVIKVDRHTLKGNIEVHVKSSDWRKHGHHQNPAYNGVVLHVVMWHDCQCDAELQNGAVIPTITIDKYLKNDTGKPISGVVSCSGIGAYSNKKLLEILDMAGAARFYEKTTQFQNNMKHKDAGQCLYCGIMSALGYAHNKEPFLELAERVPLSILESVVHSERTDDKSLIRQQALLIGNAGFLPSQRQEVKYGQVADCPYINELETMWKIFEHCDVMALTDWQVFRVRPSNFPLRRIAGMSHLVQHYREKGLLAGLVEFVREVSSEKSYLQLEAGLMVSGDDYWVSHFDFNKQCRGLSKWLIGQSRAADIVINILLPFVYAWGKDDGQIEIAEKAFALFRSYPPVETNTVERHMRTQFGLKSSQVNSAQRQQGLLHIYKKWCTQGKCRECAIVNIIIDIRG
jgi:hypothetical protein